MTISNANNIYNITKIKNFAILNIYAGYDLTGRDSCFKTRT